ncbi:isoflavone reductase family protein [Lophium mytilinum]|uniref:Isoflavone reductase family protein n=1 Tax=Lophium mytilinum TaxID=390894 RepID=A0A6A6QA84_9PEZI|nr:isoflavone reductase family protein [Lophium mytilinum]
MAPTTTLKNIILAGATGSVGAPILKALLAEPSFNVSVLTRASSSSTFPPSIPTHAVSDAFTEAELTDAFRGHDAVVIATSTTPITKDDLAYRFVNAAVKAGVKRLIPSEFGANNLDPRAQKLVPVYKAKGDLLDYLKTKEAEGLSWTSISCGSWLDWALDPAKSGNFLKIDVANRKAEIWDSGNAQFTVTTSSNTGLAVAQALKNPALSANKQIFLSDFVTSPREIIAALESQTGEKFAIEEKVSGPVVKEARAKFDAGDYNSVYTLLSLSFVSDEDVGYNFAKEQKIWNKDLGLPAATLDEVIKATLEKQKL